MRGSITERAGRWTIRYYDATGVRRRETFRLKKDAEAALNRRLDEAARGVQPIDQRAMLGDFLPEWAEATKRAVKLRTWEVYDLHRRRYIDPRLGRMRFVQLDARAVQRFVDGLSRDGLAPKTVRGVHGTLSLILGMAATYGACRPVERGQVRLPRVERRELRTPTPTDVELLAEAIDPRCWALVLLCGYCGLRQGEALGLHPADIDWLGRRIHVHRSVEKTTGRRVAETKGGRGRTVTLPRASRTR